MTKDQLPEFMKLITGVMDFYGRDVSDFAMDVWWQACRAFELGQVSKALSAHLMDATEGRFPPKPADLVRVLGGTKTDRALMAWSKAFDAAQSVGAYTDVAFDDRAIHGVIEDMGGWPKFCRSGASLRRPHRRTSRSLVGSFN